MLLANCMYAYDFEVNGFYYNIISTSDQTVGITNKSYNAGTYQGNIEVPIEVTYGSNKFKVIAIDDGAFRVCNDLKSVIIPYGIKSIGGGAFEGCQYIKKIDIPESVDTIGPQAFSNCISLKSIKLPSKITSIETSLFNGCNNLVETNIPDNVTEIHNYAFRDCNNLNLNSLPSNIKTIGKRAFYECRTLSIPIDLSNITSIPEQTFYNCEKIPSIKLSDKLVSIERQAFYGCSKIDEINLPSTIESIEDQAFSNCNNIKIIKCLAYLPPILGKDVFQTLVYMDAKLYVCKGLAKYYANEYGWNKFINIIELADSHMPDLEVIANMPPLHQIWYTTTSSNIVNPYMSAESSGINDNTAHWGFGSGIVSNEYINEKAIITFEGKISQIGTYAFHNSKGDFAELESITIPRGVTQLYDYCFYGCKNLKKVFIYGTPKICTYAWYDCTALEAITCYSEVPPTCVYSGQFTNVPKTMVVYVPASAIETYQQAKGWKQFTILPIGANQQLDTQQLSLSDTNTDIVTGSYSLNCVEYQRDNIQIGKYATLCLPFDVDLTVKMEDYDKIYTINDFCLYQTNSNKVLLMLNEVEKNSIIPASTPFIVKSNVDKLTFTNYNDVTYSNDVINPTSKKIKIYNMTSSNTLIENKELEVRIGGTYTKLTELDKTKYRAFNAEGSFGPTTWLNPFRIYVYKDDSNSNAKITSISFVFNDDIATSIQGVDEIKSASLECTYNIAGQRVAENAKGFVIKNGKKMIKK